MISKTNKSDLIQVSPEVKVKGFRPENFSKIASTKEFTDTKFKIDKLILSDSYQKLNEKEKNIITKISDAYEKTAHQKPLQEDEMILAGHEIVEFSNIQESEVSRYLVYRYKYNLYPDLKIIDEYPPCVQIEPVSVCNFRCVFCYQSDDSFSKKKFGHMGRMDLGLFKETVDELEGNVEAITLASRGEPLLHKNIEEMLEYMNGKFLAIKINSNASLLTEKLVHTILSNDVQTMVFSIDAADKDLYEKLRVRGNFETTLKNVRNYHKIKNDIYPNSNIITRISGVKVNEMQDMDEMINFWEPYADLVAFTNYTPWESSYENPTNEILSPCTELWRRLFVWWDGKINPCDYDYKSYLSNWDMKDHSISEAWNSDYYDNLREKHSNEKRNEIKPCNSCISV
jgi:sulfatase maturation enzyme AslB (radical SAM superfamily)